MLAGKLPTGSIGEPSTDGNRVHGRRRTRGAGAGSRPTDGRHGCDSHARTNAARAKPTRSGPTPNDDADAGPTRAVASCTDASRAGATRADATTPDAAHAERRRLERRLASERAERRAVIDRYEQLLDERTTAAAAAEKRTAGSEGVTATARAWLRRAISRIGLSL